VVEFAENFFVDLSNASINATILDPQGEGTIPIDDKYQISIDDVTVEEPAGLVAPPSTTTVTFTVTLDQQAQVGAPVTLDFATADGSAVAGAAGSGDYDSVLGPLSFGAGVDTQTITVTINNDGEIDPAEVFAVNLSNANPAFITNIADNRGECTITDNDYNLTVSNPLSGSGMVDVSDGVPSGLSGVLDLALGPGDSVDIIYQAGDQVTLSNEREATSPDAGSRFKGYSANPVNIAGHETVTAPFVQLWTLTPVPMVNGTITPDTPQIVEQGQSQAFTAASDLPNYTLVEAVLVDGASVNGATAPPAPALNSTTYTFTNVTYYHNIRAIFTDYGADCNTAQPVCCPPDVSTLNAEISPAGDWDYVKIVTPTIGTLKVYTSGSTDTYGYLLDTNCDTKAPITRNDDKDQINTNFYIEERNIAAGTYYVAVRHWEKDPNNPVGTGPYTLHVEFNSDDHGSDPGSATFVSCNSATAGNLETGGNQDYFAVKLSGNGILTVYTTGTTDTVGSLMDSTPAVITQDNNSGTNNNFLIQENLVAGSYYVAVSHNDGVTGTGAYTLNVDCELTHSITATAGFGGSISPEGTVSVQEGQDQTFTITPDGTNTVYDVEVDGKSVGAVNTYTFINVTKNHSIVAYFQLPADICLDISDVPMDARFSSAAANIMFLLDNSRSMDWSVLTPEYEGLFQPDGTGTQYKYVFDDPGDHLYPHVLPRGTNRMRWKSQWSGYNAVYYDPSLDYEPWPTLSNAHPDHPRSHPIRSTPTFNLSASYDMIDTGLSTVMIYVDNEDTAPSFQTTPAAAPVYIDERDPEFTRTASNGGEWGSLSHNKAYQNQYYYTKEVGDYTATWTPNLVAGEYEIWAMWANSNEHSTAVPYSINHAGGSDTVTVDQSKNGGKWILLGTYTFNAGAGSVSITYHVSSTANDKVCADAVRFVPTGTAWDWSTEGGYNGHYLWTAEDGTYTATWTPNILNTGDYEVQAIWYPNNQRSTSVTYTVNHTGGSTDVTVNQRETGGSWVSLGSYTFNAGTGGNVTLTHTRNGTTETACADAVRFVPAFTDTIDIKRAHYYTFHDSDGDGVIDPGEVYLVIIDSGSIDYYQFTDADGDDVVDVGELLPVPGNNPPAAVVTGRTYLEERQNFANWYSYYRRRLFTVIYATAKVLVNVKGVHVGFYSFDGRLIQPILSVGVSGVDETDNLLNTLYGLYIHVGDTAMRQALNNVGRYFDVDDKDDGGIGSSPYWSAEDGGACQQAFAVIMSDGYYNGSAPSIGNIDGDNNTDFDGPPYSDDYMNTLADIAMFYYERDLASGLDDMVPTSPLDSASHQHMVTYGVSYGVSGTLNPDNYDMRSGPYPAWPNPKDGDDEKIDDLWHASVNGRGIYLNAKNPFDLVKAMLIVMQDIESRMGSASSVSVNGDELYKTLGANVMMYQSTYHTDGWTGDVKAYEIDLVTGDVLTASPLWSASAQLDIQNWDSGRIIATYDGVTGLPFRFDSLTVELKDLLDANWTTDGTNARNILNYVRGDASNEQQNGGSFRDRLHKLGDIVHSSPVYKDGVIYTGANDGMLHAFDATNGDELFAYIPKLVFNNLKELKEPLYSHKFFVNLTPDTELIYDLADADGLDNDNDGTVDEADEMKPRKILVGGLGKGGKGYFALDITAPSSIVTENDLASKVLWEYPRPHIVSITDASNAAPIVVTTSSAHGFSTGDRVIIEGVQGNDGANGTWAITVVSSTTFSLNSTNGTGAYTSGGTAGIWNTVWDNMGFSYSRPAIINSKAGWIVIFGNGYNSQTGIAKLFILNATTGELLKIIDTQAGNCNGLSSPTPIDVDFDGLVDYVYAGDLNGNLWKFDLTDASASNWDVAYKGAPYAVVGSKYVGTTPQPLFQARSPEGVPQPITTKPDVMNACETPGYMVTFGTGKWLGEFDFAATTTQTVYGIWDYGDDEDDSEFLGVFDRGATPQLSNKPGSVTLLEQTVVPCDPANSTCDGDFWVVNSQNIRVLTDNITAIANPWETSTLYNAGADCGAGEGIDNCDPNGYGANPDPVNLVGWYFDLPVGGERVVSDALLRQGKVIFITYTPSQTPCGAGGDSVVMEMDACTGGRLTKPQFDINEDGIIDENDLINIGTVSDPIYVAPTGLQGEGRLHPPAILRIPGTDRERKYFSSSRGKIVTVDEKAVTLGITYWQEFE
jgi:Tfp pilus tip-associated adhesin PilY1